MKLKYDFEFVEVDDDIICVPLGEGAKKIQGVLKVNREGQEIIESLRNETTKESIIDSLNAKYDNDRDSLNKYVDAVVEELKLLNFLYE